jgi:hypothetical protein
MWIYLLIALAFVYALYKEREALGCPTFPNGEDCDNANGKAIRGTKSLPSDPTPVVFDKIGKAADFADRWVVWRVSFLISLPCILFIYFFLYQRFPSEHESLIGMFVIAAVIYFTLNFYKFHLINYARNNIDEGLKILESR